MVKTDLEEMLKKTNPFDSGNPMTFADAFKLSLIVASVTTILAIFTGLTFENLIAEPLKCLFEFGRNWLIAFAGNFITLSGLEIYVHRNKEAETE